MSLISCVALAGDGDNYFNLSSGLQWKKTFNTVISFEFEKQYHNSWEIYADLSTTFTDDDFFDYRTINLGMAYNHAIVRYKNANLRYRIGADIGADDDDSFNLSIDIGLEFNYCFRNNIKFYILQKNDFCFFYRNKFRNGFLLGFKVPLN